MQDNATARATVTEIRAEVLKTVAGHDEERRGLTDRLAVGRCVAADIVGGVEEVEVRGALTDHSDNNSMSVAKRFRFDVGGKLTLRGHADTFLVGGRMNENFVGGTLLLAGMSDDMVIGPGARVTAPLDITAAGLLAMEEKIGSAFADGALQEYAALCYEREYGPGAHACTTAVFSGQVHTTQATTFKPMVKTLSGVVNLTPGSGDAGGGGGGGDANGGAHAPPAPASPGGAGAGGSALVAAATSGGGGGNTGDLAVAAARTDDMAALAGAEDTRAANQGAEADLLAQVRTGQADDIGQADEAGQADEHVWGEKFKEYPDPFFDEQHRAEYERTRKSGWSEARKRGADELGEPYQDEQVWMVGPDGKMYNLEDEFVVDEIGKGPISEARIGADIDLDDPASWHMWPPQWKDVRLQDGDFNIMIAQGKDGGAVVRYSLGDEVYILPAGMGIDSVEGTVLDMWSTRAPGDRAVKVTVDAEDVVGGRYVRIAGTDELTSLGGDAYVPVQRDGEIVFARVSDLEADAMNKPSPDVYFTFVDYDGDSGGGMRAVSTAEAARLGPGTPEHQEFMRMLNHHRKTGNNPFMVRAGDSMDTALLTPIRDFRDPGAFRMDQLLYARIRITDINFKAAPIPPRLDAPPLPPRLYGAADDVPIGEFDDAVWNSTLGGAADEGHVAGDPPPVPTSEASGAADGDAPLKSILKKTRRAEADSGVVKSVRFGEAADGPPKLDITVKQFNPAANVFGETDFGPADDALVQREALEAMRRINGEMADWLEFRMAPREFAQLDVENHQALLDAMRKYEDLLFKNERRGISALGEEIDAVRLAADDLPQAELDRIDRMDWSRQVRTLREGWEEAYFEEVQRFLKHQPNRSALSVKALEAIGSYTARGGRAVDGVEDSVSDIAKRTLHDAIAYLEEALAGQRSPFAQDLVASGDAAGSPGVDNARVYAAVNGNEDAFDLLKQVLPDGDDPAGRDQLRGAAARRAKRRTRAQLQHALESLTQARRDLDADLNPVARLQQRAQDYAALAKATDSEAVRDAGAYSTRMAGALDSLARKYGRGDAFAFLPEEARRVVLDPYKLDTFTVAEDAAGPPPIPPRKGTPKAAPDEVAPALPPRKQHRSLERTKGQGRARGLANMDRPVVYDFSAGVVADNAAVAAARVEVAPLPPPDIGVVPLRQFKVEILKPEPIYDDIGVVLTYGRPAPTGGRPKPDLGPKVADAGAVWETPAAIPKKKYAADVAAAPVPPPRSSTPPAVDGNEWRKIEDAKPRPSSPPSSPTPKPRTTSFGSVTTPPAEQLDESALRRVFGASADAEGATVNADDAAFPSGTVSGTLQDMVRNLEAETQGYDDTVSWSEYLKASGWADDADDLNAYTSLKEFMTPPDSSDALRGTAGGAADGGRRTGQRQVAETFRRAFDESASAGEPIYATFDWDAIKAEEDARRATGTLKRPAGGGTRADKVTVLDMLGGLNAHMDNNLAKLDQNLKYTPANAFHIESLRKADQARAAARADLDRARTGLRYLLAEIIDHIDGVEDARAWDGDLVSEYGRGDDARQADMAKMRSQLGNSLTIGDLADILRAQQAKAQKNGDAETAQAIQRVIDAYREHMYRIKMAEMHLKLDQATSGIRIPGAWKNERTVRIGGEQFSAAEIYVSNIKSLMEDSVKHYLDGVLEPADRGNFYKNPGTLDKRFGMMPSELATEVGLSPKDIRGLPSRGMRATNPLTDADVAAHKALTGDPRVRYMDLLIRRAATDVAAGMNPLVRLDLQSAYLENIAGELDLLIPEGQLTVAQRIEALQWVRDGVEAAGRDTIRHLRHVFGAKFDASAYQDPSTLWKLHDGMRKAFVTGDPKWYRAAPLPRSNIGPIGGNRGVDRAVNVLRTQMQMQSPPPLPPRAGGALP